MKIFRTQEDHMKYFEAFPDSRGLIIFPCNLVGFQNEAWIVGYRDEDDDEYNAMGIFADIKDAYFYAIAWNNSDVFDIDYDDIRYVGD